MAKKWTRYFSRSATSPINSFNARNVIPISGISDVSRDYICEEMDRLFASGVPTTGLKAVKARCDWMNDGIVSNIDENDERVIWFREQLGKKVRFLWRDHPGGSNHRRRSVSVYKKGGCPMPLAECAVIETKEKLGDGVWLEVSLTSSLAAGEKIFILSPEKSFFVEEIFSSGEPVTEAGEGTTATLLLNAEPDHFREGMEIYKEIAEAKPKKIVHGSGPRRR